MPVNYEQVMKFLSYADPRPHRHMWGHVCPSIRCEDVQEALADIVQHSPDRGVAIWLVRHAQWDAMGNDLIVYWPSAAIYERG